MSPSHLGSALEYQKPQLGQGLPGLQCDTAILLLPVHLMVHTLCLLDDKFFDKLMISVLKTSEKQASCSHLTAFTVKGRAEQNVVSKSSSAVTQPDLPCGNRSCYIVKTFFPL